MEFEIHTDFSGLLKFPSDTILDVLLDNGETILNKCIDSNFVHTIKALINTCGFAFESRIFVERMRELSPEILEYANRKYGHTYFNETEMQIIFDKYDETDIEKIQLLGEINYSRIAIYHTHPKYKLYNALMLMED